MAFRVCFRVYVCSVFLLFSACESNSSEQKAGTKLLSQSAASDNSADCSKGGNKNCSSSATVAFSVSDFEEQVPGLPEFGATCVLQIRRVSGGWNSTLNYSYRYFGVYSCNGRPPRELGELPGRDIPGQTFNMTDDAGLDQSLSFAIDYFSKRGLDFKSCVTSPVGVGGNIMSCIFQSAIMTRD